MLSYLLVDEKGNVRIHKTQAAVDYILSLDDDFREFLAFLA